MSDHESAVLARRTERVGFNEYSPEEYVKFQFHKGIYLITIISWGTFKSTTELIQFLNLIKNDEPYRLSEVVALLSNHMELLTEKLGSDAITALQNWVSQNKVVES